MRLTSSKSRTCEARAAIDSPRPCRRLSGSKATAMETLTGRSDREVQSQVVVDVADGGDLRPTIRPQGRHAHDSAFIEQADDARFQRPVGCGIGHLETFRRSQ